MSAAQLAAVLVPPPHLMIAFKPAARASEPQLGTRAPDPARKLAKRSLLMKSITVDVTEAMLTMQTAYVIPQHVSDRHAKLLVSCRQQLQLQSLHAACRPSDMQLKASLQKLQLFSMHERAQQLGSGEQLSTRRSDLMDFQIRDILAGLRPTASMPARTQSGQQSSLPGTSQNRVFSLASFTAASSAAGLLGSGRQPSLAHPQSHVNVDLVVDGVSVRFVPDDAFAACAALRDVAVARHLLLSKHIKQAVQSAGAQPGAAGYSSMPGSPPRRKQPAFMQYARNADLHMRIGAVSLEAALAAGYHWQANVLTLEAQAGKGISGTMTKGAILLNERPLVTCSSALADVVHPVLLRHKDPGKLSCVLCSFDGRCARMGCR